MLNNKLQNCAPILFAWLRVNDGTWKECKIFQGRQLTIGMDLGDPWSFYCVLDEFGKVILEDKLPTNRKP